MSDNQDNHQPHPFSDFIIVTKAGEAVRLNPNAQQVRVLAAMAAQQEAALPVRIIILKFRQGGFSTIVEAVGYRECDGRKNIRGLVAAHDDDSTETLFRMTKRFHDSMPPERKRKTLYSSKREIVFDAPHHSQIKVGTAGKLGLGRSQTFQFLHLSEAAWWPHAKQTMLSVLQTVANKIGTFVIIESTANGVGGEFYDRWQAAVKHRMEHPNDLTGYLPLFFSWLDYPEYSMSIPDGHALGTLDADERALRDMGATDGQLYWRRRCVADNCGGDVALFKQEYPSTPEEAFQATGRPAIPVAITRYHRSTIEVGRRARLVDDPKVPGGVRAIHERPGEEFGPDDSWWILYRTPEDNHDYTVGGDVAEGSLSDPSDERSDSDFSTGFVLDRCDLSQVASYRGKPDSDQLGYQLLLAARYYNSAWVSPETNAGGVAATLRIKRANYPRLYRRRNADDRLPVEESDLLGWKTTVANRTEMWDHWLEHCRPDPAYGFDGQIVVRDMQFVLEEEQAIWTKNRRREHRVGGHDDSLFAGFIALQLHLRCPRTRQIREWQAPRIGSLPRYAGDVDPGVVDAMSLMEIER